MNLCVCNACFTLKCPIDSREKDNIAESIAQFLMSSKMPFDSHCIDERILLGKIDQTVLTEARRLLQTAGKKFVLSVYPQVICR